MNDKFLDTISNMNMWTIPGPNALDILQDTPVW